MDKIAVFITPGSNLRGAECDFALRVSRRLLSEGEGVTNIVEVGKDKLLAVGDIRKLEDIDAFAVISADVFATLKSIQSLAGIMRKQEQFGAVAPVSNESSMPDQRHSPSFPYQTITTFKWAAEEVSEKFGDRVKVVPALDDFCIVFERAVLNELPEDCKMTELPRVINSRGLKLGVAEGVYVHRYGDVYESGREDLLEHVPSDADNILDVGCAKGRFGELLKKRQKCTVTGIDTDAELLSVAQGRIDKVIHGDIESAIGDGLPELYDCIVCGDLVEHLNDPWKVMKGLRNCLREKGLLIASTPNVANWAILYEMMRGRWDYVPFSILSGTHIRFFTRKTLVELFENAGYKVRKVILQSFEIPPGGVQFISGLKGMREIPEEELRASEIVVVAER